VATFVAIAKMWRAITADSVWLFAAAASACVAIAAHALVDSFLTFTSTYVAFALAAGVMFSLALSERTRVQRDARTRVEGREPPRLEGRVLDHAHRV
jgi:hypothetical protein